MTREVGSVTKIALIPLIATMLACNPATKASKLQNLQSTLQRISDVPVGFLRYKLDFINDKEGWLANGKNLWRTTDGGKTWKLVFSGQATWDDLVKVKEFDFTDSQVGWMLADRIYNTKDGGSRWISLPGPDIVIHSILFLKDGKLGWAAGERYRPVSRRAAAEKPSQLVSADGKKALFPALFRTEDGGLTWHEERLPSSEGRLLRLFFLDANHGWAASDAEFFYLDDGYWRLADYDTGACPKDLLMEMFDDSSSAVYPPANLSFLDGYRGWLSFQNGYIAKSTDGGRTWCDLVNPRDVFPVASWDTYFAKLHFTNLMHGWGLAADGRLYKTSDGGAKWKVADSEVKLDDTCFLDDGSGFAVSKEGLFRLVP